MDAHSFLFFRWHKESNWNKLKRTSFRQRQDRNSGRNIADLVLPDRGGEGGCSRPPASGPCSSARQALSGNATATSNDHGEGTQCVLHPFLQRRRTPLLVLWAFLLVPLRLLPAPTVPAAGPPPVTSTAACFPDDRIAGASRVS